MNDISELAVKIGFENRVVTAFKTFWTSLRHMFFGAGISVNGLRILVGKDGTISGNYDCADGEWKHFSFTVDQSGMLKVHLDGEIKVDIQTSLRS